MDALALGMDAAPLRPAAFVEAAAPSRTGNRVAGAGLRWPWSPPWLRAAGALEVSVHRWSVPGGGARSQLALMPLLRWSRSTREPAWFAEAGVGLSWHDGAYVPRAGGGVTRWNFQDVVALGRTLGPGAAQELSLRWSHVSNASLRRPNPGDDRISLRWAFAW